LSEGRAPDATLRGSRGDPGPPAVSGWYVSAMERLVGVVQALSQARDLDAIVALVRDTARSLTGADGATFVLRDGDHCHYVDENAIAPLWKGRRFPMSACISGWVMGEGRPAVVADVYRDPRIPVGAYRPTFVKSLAMVPIRRSAPIGAIGNYWAEHRHPTAEEVAVLQALADTTSVALENAQLDAELRESLEELRSREARIQTQRDALEVFAQSLAHDLREPVRTLQSFTQLLMSPETSPDRAEEYLGHVHRAAVRMGTLIETVLRYTELDDPDAVATEPCAMSDLLDQATENLRRLLRERGAVLTADPLPAVQASPIHVVQVLQNLVSNAVHHAGRPVAVHVGAEACGDHWRFSVRDDGPGVAPEAREKIFQPFRRLAKGHDGAGLGLAICRKIVEAHGGRIGCESTPGSGATFFFTLPAAGEPGTRPTSPAPARRDRTELEGAPPLANVLLVDDMETDVELARLALTERARLQLNLRVARDGEDAIDVIREMRERGETIDMALVDINMPGMDGFELFERMRGEPDMSRIAVAMCTGSTYERDRKRASELGAVGYLVKPVELEGLRSVVDRVAALAIEEAPAGQRLVRVMHGAPGPPEG